jgi:hypothetical protein
MSREVGRIHIEDVDVVLHVLEHLPPVHLRTRTVPLHEAEPTLLPHQHVVVVV